MGCTQAIGNSKTSKFDVENDLRDWLINSGEFTNKNFVDLIYDLNSKIHLDKESMTKEKFESYFIKCFSKRITQEFMNHELICINNMFDTIKIKNFLFLVTNSKRVDTVNGFFYDKANYMFAFVKDYDRDDYDYIEKSSPGLKIFIEELVVFSLLLIPSIWLKSDKKALDYLDSKLFLLKDKIGSISDDLITQLFTNEACLDKSKLTLDSINLQFENDPNLLTDQHIREFSLTLYSI